MLGEKIYGHQILRVFTAWLLRAPVSLWASESGRHESESLLSLSSFIILDILLSRLQNRIYTSSKQNFKCDASVCCLVSFALHIFEHKTPIYSYALGCEYSNEITLKGFIEINQSKKLTAIRKGLTCVHRCQHISFPLPRKSFFTK